MVKMSGFMLVIMFFAVSVFANTTARLQIVQNVSDPALAEADIYLNSGLYLENFAFRNATVFNEVPAGQDLEIGIAPGMSASAEDIIKRFTVKLAAGESYVAIIQGVSNAERFAANPDSLDIGLSLLVKGNVPKVGMRLRLADVLLVHGVTDAPGVTVVARTDGPLIGDISYPLVKGMQFGASKGYFPIPPRIYTLEMNSSEDSTNIAVFKADLTGLAGQSAVLFASGFLHPEMNQNGASLGLFAAMPNGQVVEMPVQKNTASLQIIHNISDPSLAVVDVYLNGALFMDNFPYRNATEFLDVPAGQELEIGVAPGNSASAEDVSRRFAVKLTAGERYVGILQGVVNPDLFAANPEGLATGLSLVLKGNAPEPGERLRLTDILLAHGVTDAPAVNIIARTTGPLIGEFSYPVVKGMEYGTTVGYYPAPPRVYTMEIKSAIDSTSFGIFTVDLGDYAGGSAVIFASGFVDPEMNQNGASLALFAALPDGQVLELPSQKNTAQLQIIHNASDPLLSDADVYLNGALYLENLPFRGATGFRELPAGQDIEIGIAPGASASAEDIIKRFSVNLTAGERYVAIIQGVVNPDSFAVNPQGLDTGLSLLLKGHAPEDSSRFRLVNVLLEHGVTDAPEMNVIIKGTGPLLEALPFPLKVNLGYGETIGYYPVLPRKYNLELKSAQDASTLGVFTANLSELPGRTAVVFISGFVNPGKNQDGDPLGLFAALPDGQVIEFHPPVPIDSNMINVTGIAGKSNEIDEFSLNQNYPNPFNPSTTIAFTLPDDDFATLTIYDTQGRAVSKLVNRRLEKGAHQFRFDASGLPSGIYFYRLKISGYTETRRMMLLK